MKRAFVKDTIAVGKSFMNDFNGDEFADFFLASAHSRHHAATARENAKQVQDESAKTLHAHSENDRIP